MTTRPVRRAGPVAAQGRVRYDVLRACFWPFGHLQRVHSCVRDLGRVAATGLI